MISTSVSEYRRKCSDYIREALERPRMYYRSLEELEAILCGHAAAFEQLGAIQRDESFHHEFAVWLRRTRQASVESGWAYAIELLAAGGPGPEALFAELVEEFLRDWGTAPTTI